MRTLARYPNTALAHVARAKLEASGIEAIVAEDATASVAWHLVSALGGVRLMVHSDDEERARRVLEAELDDTYEDVPELQDESLDDDDAHPPEPEHRRERHRPEAPARDVAAASVAAIWRAALVGALIWPLQLLTSVLLLELWGERARLWPSLTPVERRRVGIASALALTGLVLSAAIVSRIIA